uniref:Cytochrome P450 n=1 Tax=Oryza brachyantha TaxID=4533 RepID=J3NCC0_ORYBR
MWAIARDGGLWGFPGVFRPERFLDEASDVGVAGGCDLQLVPFRTGRRACPGTQWRSLSFTSG